MKIPVFLTLCAASSAFTVVPPSHHQAASPTALNAATVGKAPPESAWGKKETTRKSTKPVADRMVSKIDRMMMKDVVLDPDFSITWAIGLAGPLIAWLYPTFFTDGDMSLVGIVGAGIHVLLAAVVGVQTARVRCVFQEDTIEFFNVKGRGLDLAKGAQLVQKPRNFETGRVNRWHYDKISNYGFYPSEEFPVMCYFKETETPESQWDKSIAAFDSYGRGQPHLFPGIFSIRQFKEQMKLRGVKRKPIPTLKGRMSTK